MSRFFPLASYAEDQRLSHTILTTHVLHRGFQSGVTISLLWESLRPLIRPATASIPRNFIRASGVGGLWGIAAVAVPLPFYMWNQNEIQWKDRAWRLLVNPGQVEVDDWSLVGTLIGGIVVGVRGSVTASTMTGKTAVMVLGGAGVGNMLGVAGYMVWRYGVKRGKFEVKA